MRKTNEEKGLLLVQPVFNLLLFLPDGRMVWKNSSVMGMRVDLPGLSGSHRE